MPFISLSYLAKAFTNYAHIDSPRLSTSNIDYNAVATLEGWSYEGALTFDLAAAATKYISFQIPVGTPGDIDDVIIGLQTRTFKADLPDVDLAILWDTGITGGTPIPIFSNNDVGGPSVVLFNDAPTVDETGSTVREFDFIPTGANNNRAGGQIGDNNSFRQYRQGEDFVVKITNNQNTTNRIKLGYAWLEVPASVLNE